MPDAQPFVTPSRSGVGAGVAMAGAGGGARGSRGLAGRGVVAAAGGAMRGACVSVIPRPFADPVMSSRYHAA